jgi:hypothetical protein
VTNNFRSTSRDTWRLWNSTNNLFLPCAHEFLIGIHFLVSWFITILSWQFRAWMERSTQVLWKCNFLNHKTIASLDYWNCSLATSSKKARRNLRSINIVERNGHRDSNRRAPVLILSGEVETKELSSIPSQSVHKGNQMRKFEPYGAADATST